MQFPVGTIFMTKTVPQLYYEVLKFFLGLRMESSCALLFI